MKDKQIELRAAAARLMLNDNRDIRDYNKLIDYIDETFTVMYQTIKKLEEILTAMDAAGKEERKDE